MFPKHVPVFENWIMISCGMLCAVCEKKRIAAIKYIYNCWASHPKLSICDNSCQILKRLQNAYSCIKWFYCWPNLEMIKSTVAVKYFPWIAVGWKEELRRSWWTVRLTKMSLGKWKGLGCEFWGIIVWGGFFLVVWRRMSPVWLNWVQIEISLSELSETWLKPTFDPLNFAFILI